MASPLGWINTHASASIDVCEAKCNVKESVSTGKYVAKNVNILSFVIMRYTSVFGVDCQFWSMYLEVSMGGN